MSGRVLQVNDTRGSVPKGVDGDGHNEPQPIHGGPLQAVCIYSVRTA